jgi:predicted small lipoprotein YifL
MCFVDVPASGWPAGLAACGLGGPAAADDVAVPAQDGVRGDQQPQSVAPRFRDQAEQDREQCPVRLVQFWAARLPPLQHSELMAQDQDLCDPPRFLTA